MQIKNQNFNLLDADFDFSIDAEFEIEINLDQACFANCVLVVSGWVDADDGLYPYCAEYKIRTVSGKEKIVSIDPVFEAKIYSEIEDSFKKSFDSYCEAKRDEAAQNIYEDSICD